MAMPSYILPFHLAAPASVAPHSSVPNAGMTVAPPLVLELSDIAFTPDLSSLRNARCAIYARARTARRAVSACADRPSGLFADQDRDRAVSEHPGRLAAQEELSE